MANKQTEWTRAYNEKAYDRLYITVPKGDKDKIKIHSSAFDGGSVNAFINRAIAETMERDERRRAKVRQAIIDSCPDIDNLTLDMLVREREEAFTNARANMAASGEFKAKLKERE